MLMLHLIDTGLKVEDPNIIIIIIILKLFWMNNSKDMQKDLEWSPIFDTMDALSVSSIL